MGYWDVMISVLLLTCQLSTISTAGVRGVYDERGENERRLVFDLFEKNGYNPLIRPVRKTNDSLNIRFALALSQIINLDELNQVMKTNVWLQVYWYDYQLKWDPAQYGNIGSFRINPEMVWVPDFVLFNNADGNFEVTYKSNCVIYSDSEVNWIPPAIYHSSCSIDVHYFPFDQQICEMKFGSWTHKGHDLKYTFDKNRDKLDLVDYLKSGSWDIVDCPGDIITIKDELTGEEKELIVFQFVLRRKTLFYTVNLLIPCVLISFVSVCVFALPADAGEKITLCISVSLALVVFLLLVSKILPPSLNIPLIAKYLLFTFIMNLIAILSTVVILNRNYRTPRTHQMPRWFRVLFLRELPRYLFMKRPDHEQRWEGAECTPTPAPSVYDISEEQLFQDNVAQLELSDVRHHQYELSTHSQRHGDDQTQIPRSSEGTRLPETGECMKFEMKPEIRKTVIAVKFIYQHLKQEEEYESILEDWKYVARVLDRLLLIIFLLVTMAGTAGLLLNAPHIMEYVDQDEIIADLVNYIKKAEALYHTGQG